MLCHAYVIVHRVPPGSHLRQPSTVRLPQLVCHFPCGPDIRTQTTPLGTRVTNLLDATRTTDFASITTIHGSCLAHHQEQEIRSRVA